MPKNKNIFSIPILESIKFYLWNDCKQKKFLIIIKIQKMVSSTFNLFSFFLILKFYDSIYFFIINNVYFLLNRIFVIPNTKNNYL